MDHIKDQNLFQILNIENSSTKAEVDLAYAFSKKIDPHNEPARLAWKILRDDNYRALYKKTLDINTIHEAGFFDDKEDDDKKWLNEDVRFLCTPYQKVIDRMQNLSAGQSGVVLITSGSFSPLHQGHIDMLDVAKTYVESQGEYVVGGYVVPAHDSYVATKNNGEAGMSSELRISLAQMSLKNSDWIMVDGSEALCNPCDRNFTDIVRRIKKYIGFHFKQHAFKYYYVCGEDVIGFTNAFFEDGGCICVSRGGVGNRDEESNGKERATKVYTPIFLENNNETKKHSSTLVRRGNIDLLSKESMVLYKKWQAQFNSIQEYDARNNFYYHIRVEGVPYYKAWLKEVDDETLTRALNVFRKQLIKALQNSFIDSIPPSSNLRIKVSPIFLEKQLKKLEALNLGLKTISMDQCYEGDYRLGVSRLFAVSDGQVSGIRLVPRPGMPSIEKQVEGIPDGEYYLVEDDIASGQTMKLIKSKITDRIQIKDIVLMNKFNTDKFARDEFDIVDMRDFMLGSKDGGLVTALSNTSLVRSIYAYPFVNLIERTKVPFTNVFELSKSIWMMNYKFFSSLKSNITISDLYGNAGDTFLHSGFDPETKVTDICSWNISLLEQVIEYQKLDYGIEFYHVYDDEGLLEEGKGSIDVAVEKIKEIVTNKKSYCVTLLIDDYRSKSYLIDKEIRDKKHLAIMDEFHTLLKSKKIHIDFFAFESMMVKVAKRIIKRLPANLIVKDFYKQKQSYVTMLKNQGFKIGLVEAWEDDVKYSCALLSAAWMLCRLGVEKIPSDRLVSVRGKHFASKKIITILPKGYESTETKAKVILVSAGYGYLIDQIESVYY